MPPPLYSLDLEGRRNFCLEGGNFIYIRIPKNASSSIAVAVGDPQPVPVDTYHSRIILNPENKFIFTFSRNPFSRLVSCWVNRTSSGKKSHGEGDWNNPELVGLSFNEFAQGVCETPDKDADHHFRSQYRFVEDLNVDYIGKVETIEKDLQDLFKIIHKNSEIPHLKQSTHKPYKEYYDKKLMKMVHKRFEKDFELFDYDSKL